MITVNKAGKAACCYALRGSSLESISPSAFTASLGASPKVIGGSCDSGGAVSVFADGGGGDGGGGASP